MTINDPHWPRADVWLAGDDADPEVRVIGVPTSSASLSPSRADLTPGAVRERLSRFSTYDGERQIEFGGVRVSDIGNWAVSEADMHEMPSLVEALTRSLAPSPLTIFLGGDNAVTRPLARGLGELPGTGIITFDAHHDVRDLSLGPANGTPIRGLIEDGLPGGNVHQVGIHSFANSGHYRSYCESVGIKVASMTDIETSGIVEVTVAALDDLASRCERVYVDVDIDVLDRVFAPACPGSRPGGMTVRQLSEAVWRCASHPAVTAMDFVEVDAAADPDFITLDAMAHLVLTAVSGFAARSR